MGAQKSDYHKKELNVVGICITESKATKLEQLLPIQKILEEVEI